MSSPILDLETNSIPPSFFPNRSLNQALHLKAEEAQEIVFDLFYNKSLNQT